MGGLSPWHWLIVAIVVMALFGYKKLPDAARSVGRSMRVFKSEMKGMKDDDKGEETSTPRSETPQVIEGQPIPKAKPEPAPSRQREE